MADPTVTPDTFVLERDYPVAAEAVFGSVKLADLLADIGAERRREALIGHPDFAAFSRACAEDNEPAVRRFFARAYWADAPVSCELAIARLEAFRADRTEALPAVTARKTAGGVAAFTPARRDRTDITLRTEALRR